MGAYLTPSIKLTTLKSTPLYITTVDEKKMYLEASWTVCCTATLSKCIHSWQAPSKHRHRLIVSLLSLPS